MPVVVHFPKQIRVSAESIAVNWKSFLARPNISNRNLGIEDFFIGSDIGIFLFGYYSGQSLGKYLGKTLALMTRRINVVKV